MEIRKGPVFPSPPIAPPRQREAAAVSQKADSQRLGSLGALAKHEAKVRAYSCDEFGSLARRLEDRRAAEFEAKHLSSTITNRARQALHAYQSQLDMSQDEARTALRQMLGIDAYA